MVGWDAAGGRDHAAPTMPQREDGGGCVHLLVLLRSDWSAVMLRPLGQPRRPIAQGVATQRRVSDS